MDEESQGMRTSLHSILCIAIRLGAVMMALSMFGGLFGFLGAGQSQNFSIGENLPVAAFFLVGLSISFLLWLYPGPLARLASGRSAHQVFESPISASQIQWIALSVLGMYWVMTAVLDLARIGYQLIWLSEMLGTGQEAMRTLHGRMAYDVFELILGLSLTLGARGLAGLLQKIRYAGFGAVAQKPVNPED